MLICLLGTGAASGDEYFCPSGDTPCLIAAIDAANADGDEDIITLEEGVYTLTAEWNGDIYGDLVIEGNGATIERPASAPKFGIFNTGSTIEFRELTIRGGHSPSQGGGIFNYAFLRLRDCIVEDNRVDDDGAGIYNAGSLHLLRTTVRANVGPRGGGITNEPDAYALIEDSVIDSNEGGTDGAFNNDGTMDFVNSTISRNSAPSDCMYCYGAGAGYHCEANFRNVTIIRNTGKFVGGILTPDCCGECAGIRIENSILASNVGDKYADCTLGFLKSDGHNIFGDISGCVTTTQPSDSFVDPTLGPFTDDGTAGNGHYPPSKESPAVDGAENASCTPFDQIGNPRHDGDGDGVVVCDIGAIEYQGEEYEVAVDFKPGNAQNVINPMKQGRFWLAILAGDEVDAVQIDPWSVVLGAGEAAPDRYRVKDVNRDRAADLLLRFRTPAVGIACGDTGLALVGETYAGDLVYGADTIRTVGCQANGGKRKKK
jgi:hypothetical protein